MATSDGRSLTAVRVASAMSVFFSLGFGVGTAATLAYFLRNGELPMTPMGFRLMAGPFEQLPDAQFMALGMGLVATSTLDAVAGVWLWQRQRRGALLALATSPASFGLGLGFELPLLLVGVPIRAALLLVGRRALR